MKTLQLILVGLLSLAFTADIPPIDAPAPTEGSSVSSVGSADGPTGVAVNADDLTLDVRFDKAEYTLDTVIGSTVTITNNTDRTMVFAKGSGANTVPDALKFELGGLVPLYKPEVATMDFRMDDLAPGESVTYQCDFVPYLRKDGLPGLGAGRPIEDFRTDEYVPAALGTISGSIRFTYFLQDKAATEMNMLDTLGLEERSVSIDSLEITLK